MFDPPNSIATNRSGEKTLVICCILGDYIHPRKMNMEPKNGGWVQMMFLFNWVIFRAGFRGVLPIVV